MSSTSLRKFPLFGWYSLSELPAWEYFARPKTVLWRPTWSAHHATSSFQLEGVPFPFCQLFGPFQVESPVPSMWSCALNALDFAHGFSGSPRNSSSHLGHYYWGKTIFVKRTCSRSSTEYCFSLNIRASFSWLSPHWLISCRSSGGGSFSHHLFWEM